MTEEKYHTEITTLKTFFETYCKHNHTEQSLYNSILCYKNVSFDFELLLCKNCKKLIDYSLDRLQECPHEIKPKCRSCPNPCYGKSEYKSVAKVMRYSGIRFGFSKIKGFFKI